MRGFIVMGILTAAVLFMPHAGGVASAQKDAGWTTEFGVERNELTSSGRNPYFVLEPGYQQVLEGGTERLVITVLDETRKIDGMEARIVEERETDRGEIVEVSRNYFAISTRTNSVFYLGEDVDMYKNGKISSHDGAWISGVNGARFGLMMPGQLLLHGKYYQEIAPRVAMDRAEIVSMNETVTTPAGMFQRCVKIAETTPLEILNKEFKYYVSGIGLVQDGSLKLVKHGQKAASSAAAGVDQR